MPKSSRMPGCERAEQARQPALHARRRRDGRTGAAVGRASARSGSRCRRARLIVAKPASSVTSSPANTGRRPRNGGSSMKAAIAAPLSQPGGFSSSTILPSSSTRAPSLAADHRLGERLGGLRQLRAPCDSAARASGPCPRAARPRGPRQSASSLARAGSKHAGSGSRRDHPGAKVAALQPVQAGSAQAQRREQPVELLERAAADQGQRAAARPLKIRENPAQPFRHMHRARLALDLDQRAVDVEKQGDLVDPQVRRRGQARPRDRLDSWSIHAVANAAIALPTPTKSCNGPFAGSGPRSTHQSGRPLDQTCAAYCLAARRPRRSTLAPRGHAPDSNVVAVATDRDEGSRGYVLLAERGVLALRGDDGDPCCRA